MSRFAHYDAGGEIIAVSTTATRAGLQSVEMTDGQPAHPSTHYVLDGQITAYTSEQAIAKSTRPLFDSAWSNVDFCWHDLRTLEEAKQTKHDEINEERDTREAAGFPYMGKVFDSDPRSVMRINVAALAATLATAESIPFTIEWTTADNSKLTLDAPAMRGVPVALAQFGDSLHQTAKTLKAAVEAATSIAEVEAITWDN